MSSATAGFSGEVAVEFWPHIPALVVKKADGKTTTSQIPASEENLSEKIQDLSELWQQPFSEVPSPDPHLRLWQRQDYHDALAVQQS